MLLAMDSISTSIVNVPDVWGTQVQVGHALVADLDLCGAHEMGRGGAAVGYVDDEEVGFPPGLDLHLRHGGGVGARASSEISFGLTWIEMDSTSPRT